MRKMLSYLLVMLLLVSCAPIAVMQAAAGIPGDTDENDKLAEDELADAVLLYMLEEEGHLELSEVRDAAYVYVYWDGEPRTITDSADREVKIYKPINRVVCTLSHHIEALRILKVSKDKIVGVPSGYLDPYFFAEFDGVAGVGDLAWEADVEAILALYPDVVLLPDATGPWGTTADEETELLESAGVTVILFTYNEPEIFTGELEKSGYVFEKEEEAAEFIGWHDDIVDSVVDVTSGIDEADRPKVYSEHLERQVSKADDEILTAAGGKDIFEGKEGEIEKEAILDEDPEIIIRTVWGLSAVGGYGYSVDADDTAVLEEVRKNIMEERAEFHNVTAVKNESVYIITSYIWTYLPYSGCQSLIGLCYLAEWFHPELFPELDPKAVHQEYLTRFQGLDIDLDEQGVFVYPKE